MKRVFRRYSLVILVLAAVASIMIVVGMKEAASAPIERRLSLNLRDWPRGTPRLRIALLSDIHLGNRAMTAERLDAIVRQVNAARPDLILLAGDFVVGHDAAGATERAAGLEAPLSHFRAPFGVIAVLGNHDHWTAPSANRKALGGAGVSLLENQAIRRGPVTVYGVDDAYSGHDDLKRTIASSRGLGGVPILLTHSPDLVHQLGGGFPLVLAGHTHCGQVVLPGYGALLGRAPWQGWRRLYDPRYRCGVVRDSNRIVVVTAGTGSGTTPIRLGARPDWWLVDLGPSARGGSGPGRVSPPGPARPRTSAAR